MSLLKELRDFGIFVDGVYKGHGDSARLPKIAYSTDEWIGPGMSAPVEIRQNLEKIDCEWSARGLEIAAYEQMGINTLGGLGLRFEGAYQNPNTGDVENVEFEMRGQHKEIDGGEFKRKEPGSTKIMSTLTQAKLTINGKEIYFIDALAGISRFGGVDTNSAIRQATGR
jgi:uncharacterized protein